MSLRELVVSPRQPDARRLRIALVAAGVLLLAAAVGFRASPRIALVLAGALAGAAVVARPHLWAAVLIVAALLGNVSFGTGTEVRLYSASLLVPVLGVLWMLSMMLRGNIRLVPSRVNLPLALFLTANLLSLFVGNVLWDPAVPRPRSFILVQMAQWAVFAFSAVAFWMSADTLRQVCARRVAVWTLLVVGGALALASILPPTKSALQQVASPAITRAPLWVLLGALAGGQLLFNNELRWVPRLWLVLVAGAALIFSVTVQRDSVSTWLGLAVVALVLVWERFRRARWLAAAALLAMLLAGSLFPALYEFAGGDREAQGSGESRIILATRVIEETMRNPITGLGPAAYRPYARMRPLPFYRAYWLEPNISAHNNYVDLFAHGGIVGLGLFLWFVVRYAGLGIRLRKKPMSGMDAGLRAGLLAVGAASLVIMMLADWILPFVYNIGFDGFQASVLVWLFAGGMVALEAGDAANPAGKAVS